MKPTKPSSAKTEKSAERRPMRFPEDVISATPPIVDPCRRPSFLDRSASPEVVAVAVAAAAAAAAVAGVAGMEGASEAPRPTLAPWFGLRLFLATFPGGPVLSSAMWLAPIAGEAADPLSSAAPDEPSCAEVASLPVASVAAVSAVSVRTPRVVSGFRVAFFCGRRATPAAGGCCGGMLSLPLPLPLPLPPSCCCPGEIVLFVEFKGPPPPPVARSQDRGVGAAEGVIGVAEVGGGGEDGWGGGESRLGEGLCEVGGLCGDEEIGEEVEEVEEEEDMEAEGSREGGGVVPGRVSSVATTVLPVCTVPRPSIVTPPTPWSCASKEARILSKDGAVEAGPAAVVAPAKASSDEAAAVAREVFVPEAAAELPFIVGSPALCAESTTAAGTLTLVDPVAVA